MMAETSTRRRSTELTLMLKHLTVRPQVVLPLARLPKLYLKKTERTSVRDEASYKADDGAETKSKAIVVVASRGRRSRVFTNCLRLPMIVGKSVVYRKSKI